ncbi:hypothetical protein SMC26_16550 [Actinomadura fulvescens]|uniref:Secreted protein n=1 Tax=Actinomadura fulvescens TaxID=46160 RepID=A0ABN3PJP2_9ACTN
MKAILITLAAALLAAPFVAVLEDTGRSMLGRPQVAASPEGTPGAGSNSPVLVDVRMDYEADPGWVFPGTKEDVGQPPAEKVYSTWKRENWKKWVDARKGVAATDNTVSITVSGRSAKAVVLRKLTVTIHERKPPLAGTFVAKGGAGGLSPRRFHLNLDRQPPSVMLAATKPGEVAGDEDFVDFPYTVSETEVEEFQLYPNTKRCLCSWSAVLYWDADMGGDKRVAGTSRINDNGKPFLVTATTNVIDRVRIPWGAVVS